MFLDGPVLQIAVDHHLGSGKGEIALGRFDTPPIERDDIGVDVLERLKRRFVDDVVQALDVAVDAMTSDGRFSSL